jgi:hypothetical protein
MRLSNDRDQVLIRSAVSDAAATLLSFIPSLGTGEVFAFGAGVPLPTRMKFNDVPAALRPTSEAGGKTRIAAGAHADRDLVSSVIERWRASTMSHKLEFEDSSDAGYDLAPPIAPGTGAAPAGFEPQRPTVEPPHRPSILRKPITADPAPPPPGAPRWR